MPTLAVEPGWSFASVGHRFGDPSPQSGELYDVEKSTDLRCGKLAFLKILQMGGEQYMAVFFALIS